MDWPAMIFTDTDRRFTVLETFGCDEIPSVVLLRLVPSEDAADSSSSSSSTEIHVLNNKAFADMVKNPDGFPWASKSSSSSSSS